MQYFFRKKYIQEKKMHCELIYSTIVACLKNIEYTFNMSTYVTDLILKTILEQNYN